MAKCYTCGTTYNGWSCPICSARQELQQAIEKSTKEQHEALAESLEEQANMALICPRFLERYKYGDLKLLNL